MTKYKYTRKIEKGKGCKTILFVILGIISLCMLSGIISIASDWEVFKEFGQDVYHFFYLGNKEALQRKKEESLAIGSLESYLDSEFPSERIFINIWPIVSNDRNAELAYVISVELINPDFVAGLSTTDVLDSAEAVAEAVYNQYPNIDEYESISIKITKRTNLLNSITESSSNYWFEVYELGSE
jgi:hypothetical protein